MNLIEPKFFERETFIVAKELIGKVLLKKIGNKIVSGKIVETEGYLHINDDACHAASGKSLRNAAMFGNPGNIYVYLNYGLYYCFNFSTLAKEIGSAVLIRALEPIDGIDFMSKNRKSDNIFNLCSGPGKLCKAFDINKKDNNKMINSDDIFLYDNYEKVNIIQSKRIGINKSIELNLRFFQENSKFVSKL